MIPLGATPGGLKLPLRAFKRQMSPPYDAAVIQMLLWLLSTFHIEQSQKRYMVSGTLCPLISFIHVSYTVSFVVRGIGVQEGVSGVSGDTPVGLDTSGSLEAS